MEFLSVSPDGLLSLLRVPFSPFELPISYIPAMLYNLVASWYLLVDSQFLNWKNDICQLLMSFICLIVCAYVFNSQCCSLDLAGSQCSP